MAYLVARGDGRYEIRESEATPGGPRSRTLATFRALSSAALARAERRARHGFDRHRIEARAAALGVPRAGPRAARLARDLTAEIGQGEPPPVTLSSLLHHALGEPRAALPDTLPPLVEWLGAAPERRGATLRDLLRVAGRIPRRRAGELRYPRITSAPPDRA
jgi:hypothetical protein